MVFLAGVANAEIFKNNDLFATAKTLIDSSITIGVSAEDIRAGQGAKLYGKYFHTSTFDLKMTDAMFKLEYIAANVGADLTLGGDVFTEEEHIIEAGGAFELAHSVVPMQEGAPRFIYYKKSDDSFYRTLKLNDENYTDGKVTITGIEAGTWCVKYLYTNDSARKLVVSANFTPDTLSVYLTANLYAGDDANPSTGTKIGTVTIKVPRFLLSGSQELSMSMTGASNTAFEGSALASKGKGCDSDGVYAEIIEVVTGRTYADLVALAIDGEADGLSLAVGESEELVVYGRYEDTAPAIVDNSKVKFEATGEAVTVDTNGIITAASAGTATVTVSIKDRDGKDVSSTIEVTVPAAE